MELIEKLKDKEIDCHTFLDEINHVNEMEKIINIMNKLSEYSNNEECVVCHMALYKHYNFSPNQLTNLEAIKDRFKILVDNETEIYRPEVISLFYADCGVDDNEDAYFTYDALKDAADAGDSLALYLIADDIFRRLNNQSNRSEQDETEMKRYYQLAANKGNRKASLKLAEMCYEEDREAMDKINELYPKFGKVSDNINIEMMHELIVYLNRKLKEKEQLIDELIYEPGGRGYRAAKESFEKLVNS